MNRLLCALLIVCLSPLSGNSQEETIYLENFAAVPVGTGFTTSTVADPITIGQGEASLNGATLQPNFGRFSVSSTNTIKHLTSSSIIAGGPVSWQTAPIDISCYSNISIAFEAMGSSQLNDTPTGSGAGDAADYMAVDITLVDTDETFTDLFIQYGAFAQQTFTFEPPFLNICGNPLYEEVIFTVRFFSDKTFESHSLYSFRVTGESTVPSNITYSLNCDSGLDLQANATSGCYPEFSLDGISYNTTGSFENLMANTTYTIYVRDFYFPDCFTSVDVYVTDCDVVLPIELIAFTGKPDGEEILLEWETATEQNNDYIAVEHSADGIQFREIGKVKGAGTTSEFQYYQFLDRNPQFGTNYYRLRQVDLDGTSTSHHIIAVEMAALPPRTLPTHIRIYPTVASEMIRIELKKPLKEPTTYYIYSLVGRLVYSDEAAAQTELIELTIRDLPAGAYILSLTQEGQTATAKFFKS